MTFWERGFAMAMTLAMVLALVAPVAAEDPRVVFDVDPRRCAVEPRSLDELEQILTVGTPQPPARTAPGTPISAGSETGHARTDDDGVVVAHDS